VNVIVRQHRWTDAEVRRSNADAAATVANSFRGNVRAYVSDITYQEIVGYKPLVEFLYGGTLAHVPASAVEAEADSYAREDQRIGQLWLDYFDSKETL
jgi:hypothetical protein